MLCYYYPPLTDVGSKRSVAFSKYFKKHGWNPCVLSVKNPDRAYCSTGDAVPPDGVCTKYSYSIINLYMLVSYANAAFSKLLKLFGINLRTIYFYNIFCIPDLFWGWIPLTIIKAARLIRKRDIDIIYVSCTPHSSGIIGIILKRLSGKPLVIDYRDPFHISAFKMIKMPRFRRKINRAIQDYYLKRADITIVNNEDTKNIYIDEYPIVENKIYLPYIMGLIRNICLLPEGKNSKLSLLSMPATSIFMIFIQNLFLKRLKFFIKTGGCTRRIFSSCIMARIE
mgnify:CR=1 FL=1